MEIKFFRVKDLRIEECFGFFKKVETETTLLTLETDKAMVSSYIAALTAFDSALNQNIKNSHTNQVAAADQAADLTWRNFRAHAKAMRHYPEPVAAANAVAIYSVFEKYGDIYKMPYSQEYASMYNLLQEIDALGNEAHQSCFSHLWLAQLHNNYNAFMEAQRLQNIEAADYQKGIINETHSNCCTAYYDLTKRVNALAMVTSTEPYAAFISRVNTLIQHEESTLAGRKGRAEAKNNNEEV